jgi:putative membrane protein
MRLLIVWLLNALSLWLVTLFVPGVQVGTPAQILFAALVLGLVNTLVKPVLVLLTLPVTVATLGLFLFVLNGLLFWAVGSLLKGFHVEGFWWGVLGAFVYSLISWALSAVVPRRLGKR